ncbi:MAG: YggS family pyridoxal phosphate-dependent enzyme [Proteobacteria bacterium]|nr:YggS family pyridoxal phosphate-dependent enzyme [Pseudomonadota bacterium]
MIDPVAASVTRLEAVRAGIARAAADCGRKAREITLVAVSKTYEAADILPVIGAGQRVFGENRVQEAMQKWPALRAEFPDIGLQLIGPLQSNKALDAVRFFDRIESLDRPKLAAALADAVQKAGRQPGLLVQVNTGSEAQKAGILPQDADAFLAVCRRDFGLQIDGLMCIPPVDQPPSPHFALLAKIATRNGLSTLSMGMSADYAAAIQCGATHVRVGSAIFGTR